MAYSSSPYTLGKIIHEYGPLLGGNDCVWKAPPGAPYNWSAKWAYKLREGLHIARLHPDKFPPLAKIAHRISVRATVDSVTATIVQQMSLPLQELTQTPHVEQAQGTHNIASVRALVAESIGILHIKDVSVSDEELDALATDLNNSGKMLLRARDGSLTIAPDDPAIPLEARYLPSNLRDAT